MVSRAVALLLVCCACVARVQVGAATTTFAESENLCHGFELGSATSSCSSDWKPDMAVVKKMLLLLLDQMKEVGIRHWISYGTLLGAIRDGGFIAGDDDADTAIWEEDASKLWESAAAHAAFQKHGFKLVRSMNHDFKLYPIRKGCASHDDTDAYFPDCCENVDVFLFKHGKRCAIRGCSTDDAWSCPCPHPSGNKLHLDSFPACYADTVVDYPGKGKQPLKFFGRQVPVPAHYNKLLTHFYGDEWHSPHPSQKYPKGGRVGCDDNEDVEGCP